MQKSKLEDNFDFENANRVQTLMEEIEREYRNSIGYYQVIRDTFVKFNPKYLFESVGETIIRTIYELREEKNNDLILHKRKKQLESFPTEAIIAVSTNYEIRQAFWKRRSDSLVATRTFVIFCFLLIFLYFSNISLDLFLLKAIYLSLLTGATIVYFSFFVFKPDRELKIVNKCVDLLENIIVERKYQK